jgi:hypothetical protein
LTAAQQGPAFGPVFHEIKNVKQEPGPGRRRWFESDHFDLIVWFDAAERIAGFQFCYNFGRGEQALTWREGGGFAHSSIDTGSESPFKNCTPILVADGAVPWKDVTDRFVARSASLEPALREFVQDKLKSRRPA